MPKSDTRILTTHAGSLPRPPELTRLFARRARGESVDDEALAASGRAAVAWVVGKQREIGIDVISNGEQQRESFVLYLRRRLSGIGGVGALAITADAFFLNRRDQIVALAARYGLPATSPWREAAAAGALMSYGTSDTESYRQIGRYAGRILNGEKPADLPVQQSTISPSGGGDRSRWHRLGTRSQGRDYDHSDFVRAGGKLKQT